MLKGLKHENKEEGKTQHETPSSKNHKAIQNKNNSRTTALKRSVKKNYKRIKAPLRSTNQCHVSMTIKRIKLKNICRSPTNTEVALDIVGGALG